MTTPADVTRKHRADGNAPYYVIHPSFTGRKAAQAYAPPTDTHDDFGTGHMPDEITREYAKRMHYAARRI